MLKSGFEEGEQEEEEEEDGRIDYKRKVMSGSFLPAMALL
jgi:hypothetical protein